jgi:hypothetical protein
MSIAARGDGRADERPAGANQTSPASPRDPVSLETGAAGRNRFKAEGAAPPKPKELAARIEPEEANPPPDSSQGANRALKARSRATEREAAQAERKERERTRAAALDAEPSTPRLRPRDMRRQARSERRTRMARDGSLDQLLDEFSRSGADFLHERTIRVGTRYLVERTTRYGTQYFYEQSPR